MILHLIKYNFRYERYKVSLEENQNVDYIYSLRYGVLDAVQANFKPLEVTETTVECNLNQRQRSSQQILDLADYLLMHYALYLCGHPLIRRYESSKSFTSDIPLWIELTNPNSLLEYFDKFESNDIMVIWDNYNEPSNLNDIEGFCLQQNWRCTERNNVRGSEASVTILYDIPYLNYEFFTRAKTQLVIVTIAGKKKYFLQISKMFAF